MVNQRCKITVIKRYLHEELVKGYLDTSKTEFGLCDRLHEGQEFIVDDLADIPAGFCPWAWGDIRHDILIVASGGKLPGLKYPNMIISGCTDWFRPVIFKIERLDDDK